MQGQVSSIEDKETLASTVIIADDAENTNSALSLAANELAENPQPGPTEIASSSIDEPLPLEEKLRLVLEPEDEHGSIKAAKDFLLFFH